VKHSYNGTFSDLGDQCGTLQSSNAVTSGNIHLELLKYYAVFYDVGWFLGRVLEEVVGEAVNVKFKEEVGRGSFGQKMKMFRESTKVYFLCTH